MKGVISLLLLGSSIGFFFYHYDPILAEFIMYKLIPSGIFLYNSYMAFQAYHTFKVQVSAGQALS